MTRKPLRSLIVEDSPDDAELVIRELHRGGYDIEWKRVETLESMIEALDEDIWDIVLSDYNLPRFSGLSALDVLSKKRGDDIPIIIISGKIGEEVAVETMKAGANDYVMKNRLKRLVPAVDREIRDAEVRRGRKQAERELHRSQENLAKAQAIACLGFWEWNIASNTVHWSEEMYRIHGMPMDVNPTSEIARSMVHPDDLQKFDDTLAKAYAGNTFESLQYRIIKSDGQVRFVNNKMELRYDSSGRLSWMLGTLLDVTELVLAQEEASRARALEEMEIIRNTLWANVSHEIRTPLTSIKGIASTLLMTDVKWDEETQRDFISNIDRESDRLISIVNDVLDISKIEAGVMRLEMERMNIQEIVNNLIERLNSLTEHHILEIIMPRELPSVVVDELRIGQLITNLIENAVFYSFEDTVITFKVEVDYNNLVVSVADHGCGIRADHLEKVFDRFYRLEEGVKRRRGGTGLGLTICKAIINAHGGKIWVTSEVDAGSVFSFSLPHSANIAAANQPPVP